MRCYQERGSGLGTTLVQSVAIACRAGARPHRRAGTHLPVQAILRLGPVVRIGRRRSYRMPSHRGA